MCYQQALCTTVLNFIKEKAILRRVDWLAAAAVSLQPIYRLDFHFAIVTTAGAVSKPKRRAMRLRLSFTQATADDLVCDLGQHLATGCAGVGLDPTVHECP